MAMHSGPSAGAGDPTPARMHCQPHIRAPETVSHTFWDCPFAGEFWTLVLGILRRVGPGHGTGWSTAAAWGSCLQGPRGRVGIRKVVYGTIGWWLWEGGCGSCRRPISFTGSTGEWQSGSGWMGQCTGRTGC
ncbi:hypothetical protein AAFF_G00029350 [Aldrovandia affinis]|uniref:Reverse transcriptase zinc-binding domain-containing protein n=1 Tax=Aldrovandia affinis TaxID=143900 RepID=A0AAD7WG94_9TELE|nr:hypothetical protein AAFF_G00029350 [Aldrovandia affinis]